MNFQQLQELVNIYNNLLTIQTKGKDTWMMADCQRALFTLLSQLGETIKEDGNGKTEPSNIR